jgi:hypothetical protein
MVSTGSIQRVEFNGGDFFSLNIPKKEIELD